MYAIVHVQKAVGSQTRETLDEVRTRLIEELRLRTEERVRHWNQLGDWCWQRSGRYIGVEWGPDLRGGSSSAAEETTRKVTGEVVEEGVSDNSRATGNTVNVEQVSSGIEAEELNFESSAELGDKAQRILGPLGHTEGTTGSYRN